MPEVDLQNQIDDTSISTQTLKNKHAGEDYDPHLHRDTLNATSLGRYKQQVQNKQIYFLFVSRNYQTLIHLLKGTLGTGIMAMPYAFSKAGYVAGFINTVVVTLISTHCFSILVRILFVPPI